MELEQIIEDVADALVSVDATGVPFKNFQAGVGPYGEPQVVGAIAKRLNDLERYGGVVYTRRSPDLLIQGAWALEFKTVRPFGDNGKAAENWSIHLLHPYEGNVSLIGDCLKLEKLGGPERKAGVVVGYEHTPPQISLAPVLAAFEIVARDVVGIRLNSRVETRRAGLVHPVHQTLLVECLEVLGRLL